MSVSVDRTATRSEHPPEGGIVVLTWENYDEASECLDSLESVDYPNYRVIVVDNGSGDGSVERLQQEYGWCEFVCNDRNLGVTRGNNAGIEHALECGVDYVLLLNDDTIVTKDFLTPLVETAEREDQVAVVGGTNYYASSGEIHNVGAEFSTLLGGCTFLHEEPKDTEPYEVDYVPTCLALIDRDFIVEQDVLSEEYFLGMEDVDLAWEARRSGRRVMVAPDSEIYHRLGSTSTRTPFTVYHRKRNRLQFASRHLSPPARVAFLVSFYLLTAASCWRWVIRGEKPKSTAALLGIFDYHTGREFRPYDAFA